MANAWILALGGASWPQLGSDGAWVELLAERGVGIAPLRAANCGFDVEPTAAARVPVPVDGTAEEAGPRGWSRHFRSRFAGQPLKTIALTVGDAANPRFRRRGECVVTQTGVEGNLVYAASADIHHEIAARAGAVVHLDLLPDRSLEYVRSELARPRGSRSLSTHMKSRLGVDGVKAALLHELLPPRLFAHPADLAGAIKSLPLTLARPRPLAEAISTAGGVRFEELTRELMLRRVRGVFCAGEMLDWDAPTGGYLLTAALASGVVAGRGAFEHLGACGSASKVG